MNLNLKPTHKWRKWTYAPLWVDLLCQFLIYLDWRVLRRLLPTPSEWAWVLLDKYCKCPKCEERGKKMSPPPLTVKKDPS